MLHRTLEVEPQRALGVEADQQAVGDDRDDPNTQNGYRDPVQVLFSDARWASSRRNATPEHVGNAPPTPPKGK